MSGFWSKLFRSRAEVEAERAEVEGRFDDAARLYVEAGQRDEAFRVLVQAAEGADSLSRRRDFLSRAIAIARTDPQRDVARASLARVVVAEFEARPASSDDDRIRLHEAATDLERAGHFREAATAFKQLGDRESMERCLVASGDIDSFEKEANEAQDLERNRLQRRNALETFEGFWGAGDREGALNALDAWLRSNTEDHEARTLADERRSTLVERGRFDGRFDGTLVTLVGSLPCAIGREAAVIVRGAGVSREHCVVEASPEGLTIRDNGSRNGTTLRGLAMTGAVLLEEGAQFGLGPDLALEFDRFHGAPSLVVARGMDRGKRVVFVLERWLTPIGTIEFRAGRAVFTPTGLVKLLGQRVVAPIILARGDRIDGVDVAGSLEVLR
jgi:hypothetical protein